MSSALGMNLMPPTFQHGINETNNEKPSEEKIEAKNNGKIQVSLNQSVKFQTGQSKMHFAFY